MTTVPDIEQLKAEIPPGPALDRLTAAARVADQLRARGDELLDQFVDAARADGRKLERYRLPPEDDQTGSPATVRGPG